MSDAYEGPECQEKYTHTAKWEFPKPNYTIRFHNADNIEVGMLDFNGEGLAFEGNANESAIVFINWIDTVFRGRLAEERNKVRTELEAELLKLKKGIAASNEYIQGRWDLIGEFQDIIKEGIEK